MLQRSPDFIIKPNTELKARENTGILAVKTGNETEERGRNTKQSLCNFPVLIWWSRKSESRLCFLDVHGAEHKANPQLPMKCVGA